MTAPTLLEALRRKGRYNRLIWGDAFEVVEQSDRVTVVLAADDEVRPYGPARIDLELASLLAFGRRFTGVAIAPLALALRQKACVYVERYVEMFGVVPRFDADRNALSFARGDAERPLISANTQVHQGLVEVAETALMQMTRTSIVAKVREELGKTMHGEEPTLREIARRLCVGERTLQRRLSTEGTSFSQLLDECRREVAQHRLKRGHSNVPELAFLLGFADTNSFYRAFRRWTGTTPESFRRAPSALN
jgi:AraC-like DNA-binding protein